MLSILSFLKWTARILSIILISIILLFAFGENENPPTANEILGLIFFPLGIMIGFVISFRKTTAGAFISIFSLLLFYLWHYISRGELPDGIAFIAFCLPAVLFLVFSFLDSKWRHRHI
jgi:hypothetical protein